MVLTLKTVTTTTFKKKPIQSAELPEDLKQRVEINQELELESFEEVRDHVRLMLKNPLLKETPNWYAFGKHVEIREDGKRVYPKTIPAQVKLAIPYKSQRDNYLNPDGSCNVTSLAMCMRFLGVARKTDYGQFEDELYEYATNNGLSRHDPHDLAVIVEDYGLRNNFLSDGNMEIAKEWLADGNPAVIHGYFTDFGHIVVLAGYDEYGFLCHDPFGEWYSWGYDRNDPYAMDYKGEYIHYSYGLIQRLCMPDGKLWIHLISKK